MIDVSDGLLFDLGHLLRRGALTGEASLGARLRPEAIPLSPPLAGLSREDALPFALHGGEGYALLFTLPPALAPALRRPDAPPAAVIGEVTAERGLSWDPPEAAPADLGRPWAHFGEGR